MKNSSLLKVIVVILLGSSGSIAVQAVEPVAKVIKINNAVLVNTGKSYASAQSGQALKRGHRVLTLERSSAIVEYRNGCKLELGPNSLLTVESEAQCIRGGAVISSADTGSALGGRWAPSSGGAASADAAPLAGGVTLGLIGAAGAVAAVVTGAALSDNHNHNNEISPEQ